ncbi:MAG: DUF2116 family Zn-ribbon domain-containing protein [Clostridia bacterium]|nr:DUF2116 family Zn-ribbon domain-containing protein [Clostridia bacterium]
MAKFCGKCGTPLNPDGTCEKCRSTYKSEVENVKKRKSKTKIIILVILAVVIVSTVIIAVTPFVGIAAVFFYRQAKSHDCVDCDISEQVQVETTEPVTESEAETEDLWQQKYMDTLSETDYEYYALYDIDKNGTPELLLNDYSGGFECFVIGFDGNTLITYGSIPNKYSLYGYSDGNGIIYSTGGTGILCYSVYMLENSSLTEVNSALLSYCIDPYEGIEEYKYQGNSITSTEYNKIEKEITDNYIEFLDINDLSPFGITSQCGEEASIEGLGEELVSYLMQIYEPDGEYVVSYTETTEKNNMISFVVRYQMSDEIAKEIISNGGIPSANTLVGIYTVNSSTGDVYDENNTYLCNLFN